MDKEASALGGKTPLPKEPVGAEATGVRSERIVNPFAPSEVSHSTFEEATETGRLQVGPHSYGTPIVHIYRGDRCGVTIGSYCSIGEDVEFLPGGMHDASWVSTFPFKERCGVGSSIAPSITLTNIEVGSDVWIGRGARILPGVLVGHGAIVGAYSVVASDVRPYAIVVGNPAHEIRRRFSDEVIERLLAVGWWKLPIDRIRALIPLLSSGDVMTFLNEIEP